MLFHLQKTSGIALVGDEDGKYYDFDISKLTRQSCRKSDKVDDKVTHYPTPPNFEPISKEYPKNSYDFIQTEYHPALSYGKKNCQRIVI